MNNRMGWDCGGTGFETVPLCNFIADAGVDAAECVECMADTDCREGSTAPNPSPLGICTPDQTCTCWVNGSETWTCTAGSDCPTGYECAQDLPGSIHFACLRSCSSSTEPTDGLACENRTTSSGTGDVWVPMTTCFAFDLFGDTCSGLDADCSVDGNGPLVDGICNNLVCTYSCWDGDSGEDSWCPEASTCGSPVEYCE